ncbi:flagellar biosynthetic protein FliR [Enterococcus cecorum]|uniref:Flagellar biosynthetic protein FliR n=1 Tax=Enterococcus cecorum TaxID=44008 RepID=A0A366SIS7_9ENTE|nr:flagellar biosynthetic protein FliR [Enterococcus cecorum]RBR31752.1 flagellar biosynthetic protein FliR [Enterococcus cecorum]
MSDVIIQTVLLIFIRVFSFIVVAPFFSQRGFPILAKIVVSFAITTGVLPTVPTLGQSYDLFVLGLFCVKETLLGLALGYICQLIFAGFEIAGHLIDFQVGFSMAQAYDSQFQIMMSQFGKIYYWMGTALMFITNLHLMMLQGLINSFKIVGLTQATLGGNGVDGLTHLVSMTIEMGFNLAAPLVLSALLIDIVLGVISRSIPQINVLVMGLSVKSIFTFIVFMLLLPNLVSFLLKQIPNMIIYMREFLNTMK